MGVPVGFSVNGTSGNVAAATATATLLATLGRVTHISGFYVTGGGATAGSIITVTVTGVKDGPFSYSFAVPTGAAVGAATLDVYFDPPIPATGPNTAIVVSAPSFGAGNTNACVVANGFQTPPN